MKNLSLFVIDCDILVIINSPDLFFTVLPAWQRDRVEIFRQCEVGVAVKLSCSSLVSVVCNSHSVL